MVIVTLVKSSTASLLILAVHTAAAVSGQPNKTVETNQQYTRIWTVGLTRHSLHEFAVNILNLKGQDDRIGWKVTGRVNIRPKRGFATLSTMVSCYAPWSKSIQEEPFQKLFQLLNHHEKILVMMNFSKKVFPRVTQRYQLKPVPGSLLLPARPLTAISLASKQALVFGYHLTTQLLIKPLTVVYGKSCWYPCHSSQYDKNNSCSFSKFIKLIVISSFISSDFLRDKIYYV